VAPNAAERAAGAAKKRNVLWQSEHQKEVLVDKPRYHLLVCASYRTGGDPKGVCHKKGSTDLLGYLENEILDRGLDARVSSTGCLKQCTQGPILIVYPEGHWYGKIDSEAAVDAILDSLESEEVADIYLIS
jgi:(2Fe-2S) ferredoxin